MSNIESRYQTAVRTINRLESVLCPLTVQATRRHEATGAYRFIPLSLDRFLEQLDVVRDELGGSSFSFQKHSFIDVGCGPGTKVVLAQECGFKAYGIELNSKYVRAAKRLLHGSVPKPYLKRKHFATETAWIDHISQWQRIIKGDGRKHDYSPYDVIYFYCPMQRPGNEYEAALEGRLISTAKRGALFMVNGGQLSEWHSEPSRVERISDLGVWRKK